MAEPAKRRPVRRRRWWRRSALPRSRSALALGAVVAVVLLLLLLLGLTRGRPGRDVPAYQPAASTTTVKPGPVVPPSITASPRVPKAATTTTHPGRP